MTTPLNIFFSVDENYIQHFTVALTSLLENNAGLEVKVFVLHNVADVRKFDEVDAFFEDKYQVKLNLINIGRIDFKTFTTNAHYTSATYFRLFLAELLPKDVDDGLLLDSDLIVTGSIKELAGIDIGQHNVYAASEAFVEHNTTRLTKLGIKMSGYFNAGVLLVNVKAWRTGKLTQQFLQIANDYMSRLEWYDQDILNIYFRDSWGEFDKKYNAVHLTKQLSEMPVIVHYASVSKPWYYIDTHPYNYLYWMYLKLTPFKGRSSVGFSLNNFVLKNGRLVKRKLRRIGIIKTL